MTESLVSIETELIGTVHRHGMGGLVTFANQRKDLPITISAPKRTGRNYPEGRVVYLRQIESCDEVCLLRENSLNRSDAVYSLDKVNGDRPVFYRMTIHGVVEEEGESQ